MHFQDVITALSVAHFERKVKWNKDIIFDTQQGQVIVGSIYILICMEESEINLGKHLSQEMRRENFYLCVERKWTSPVVRTT